MATLRVNESRPAKLGQQPEASLAWWRATSTAKRRQRVPMPCDRAPKSSARGSHRCCHKRGPAVPRRRNGLAYFGPTGVQEQGAGTRGLLGNLRDPVVSVVDCRLESRHPKLQVDPQLSSRAGGDEKRTKRRYRQAKETKCGEMGGRESEHPVVPLKWGNRTEGTPWREGGAVSNNRWRETWRVHRNPWTCPRNHNG